MSDLIPTTALGETKPRVETHGNLTLSENSGLALASLALRRDGPVPTPFGMMLPDAGRCFETDGLFAFWTGPGQWMIAAVGRADQDFAADLTQETPGCSITEQTDAWVAFDISVNNGTLSPLLEKLVNVDLALLAPGGVTRTGVEHFNVFVIRRADASVTVLGMRSAARSLWHTLETAAIRYAQGESA